MANRRYGNQHTVPVGTTINKQIARQFGIVGCWPMQEGAGAIIKDYSGYANDGTLKGTLPAWSRSPPGQQGNVLFLDGSTNYVSLGQRAYMAGATYQSSFSVAGWFFSPGNLLNARYVLNDDNSANGWALTNNGGAPVLRFFIRGVAGTVADGATTLSSTQWQFLAGVYNAAAATLTVFLNGRQDGQLTGATGTPPASTKEIEIGGNEIGTSGSLFNKQARLVTIANMAWTPTQVRKLYNDPWYMFRPPQRRMIAAASVATKKLFRQGDLNGIGSGGAFFKDPLA